MIDCLPERFSYPIAFGLPTARSEIEAQYPMNFQSIAFCPIQPQIMNAWKTRTGV